LPRWLSILHDDKYHEFLRFRGWCPPPAVAGRPAGPRCTGGLLPQEALRGRPINMAHDLGWPTPRTTARFRLRPRRCKGGGFAPPCQWPPGWPDRHPQHGGQPECGKRDPV